MPEKVAVLSKIRLLLFISPKFTTCRHPRAICRKDTAVRIEADGYFLWLEKWIMQCYFVMSSEKKFPTKFPQCGVCFLSVSCLIIARCRRSGSYQNVFSGSISHHHFCFKSLIYNDLCIESTRTTRVFFRFKFSVWRTGERHKAAKILRFEISVDTAFMLKIGRFFAFQVEKK